MLLVWSDHLCCVFLQYNWTALHEVALQGRDKVMSFLISSGANVNAVTTSVS